jgi:acetyl-CoA carboxylase biotin carboxyl carrier protein
VELDLRELRELLAVINQTDIAEFTLKSGDFELVVRKGVQTSDPISSTEASSKLEGAAPAISAAPLPSPAAPSTPPPSVAATPSPPPRSNERLAEIISPMVGTFYRAPGPDEPAFVEVGDRIRSGQTVCIIEAMKLMNELEAEVSGEIVEILLQNGEPVEYGQVLMRVNPS